MKEKKNNDLPKEELKNLGIAGVYLFGSQSENVAVGKLSDFDVAVLTNLSPEHIEAHGGFEKYREAKTELFKAVKKIHIINLITA